MPLSAIALLSIAALLGVHGQVGPGPPGPDYQLLQLGVPMLASVPRGGVLRLYTILPLPLPRTSIVCSSFLGDASLYATVGPWWDPAPGNAEVRRVRRRHLRPACPAAYTRTRDPCLGS